MNRRARAVASVAACLLATACGSPGPDSPSVAYREAESVESLAVPPDLTKPDAAGALEVPGAVSARSVDGSAGSAAATSDTVLPEFDGLRLVRAGAQAWLELDGVAPQRIWPGIEDFLDSQGLAVAESDPMVGIVKTEWATRQDGPDRRGLTGFFDSILGGGSDNIRDSYAFRLERMADGGTRIFVAHRSAQEVGSRTNRRDVPEFAWERQEGDPEMRAEMMQRLLVHLGVGQARAEGIVADGASAATIGGTVRYVETGRGSASIVVQDRNRRRVFGRLENALVGIGAEIREVLPAEGLYRVRWTPPADSEASADEARTLDVHVRGGDEGTRLLAADAGGTPRSGALHKALLRELTVAMGGDPDAARAAEDEADEDEGSEDLDPLIRPRSST